MKNRKVRIEPCQEKLVKANFWLRPYTAAMVSDKVEKILKASMDLISSPSPSVKFQIMGGKV